MAMTLLPGFSRHFRRENHSQKIKYQLIFLLKNKPSLLSKVRSDHKWRAFLCPQTLTGVGTGCQAGANL
jgi:hypothetical protein